MIIHAMPPLWLDPQPLVKYYSRVPFELQFFNKLDVILLCIALLVKVQVYWYQVHLLLKRII